MGLALLADIFSLFTPVSNGSDTGPPITKLGYVTMITIVFSVAALSINLLMKPTTSPQLQKPQKN